MNTDSEVTDQDERVVHESEQNGQKLEMLRVRCSSNKYNRALKRMLNQWRFAYWFRAGELDTLEHN